jgi:peptidoglycan hydrolase-like protein with peptidoglycan-binding domain
VSRSATEIQQFLTSHGFDIGPHGVDGQIGDDTTAAIEAFQRASGLDPDGVWGPLTDGKAFGAPASAAPAFPLPAGWYFGPKEGPQESVSGYYSHREDLRTWQQRMADRGWIITPDGLYGPETASTAREFQAEKGLEVDGLIGVNTWTAAWTAPITPAS